MLRRLLLGCGVLASLVYVATDVLAAVRYPDYHSFTSRVVSELMASGAPTERLVDPLFLLYDALVVAFAVGIWMTGPQRRVRATAGLVFAVGAVGLLGPTLFEMNVRGSGGPPRADTLHIALTAVLGAFILASMAVGATIGSRWFRLYSIATLLVTVVFAVLTSLASRDLAEGAPTPWVGLLERVDIYAYLLWLAVLAVSFLREAPAPMKGDRHDVRPWIRGPRLRGGARGVRA
jgi:hypothetical protein